MDHSLVTNIASCIIAAWALAILAHLLKQPLILAYLVAGFAIGPHGLGFVKDADNITLIAQIGLKLLLFMIGLEIDLKKMLKAGRSILFTSGAQILGGFMLGLLFFRAVGFPLGGGQLDALYLAAGAALSSTVIVVKLLYDKRELDTLAGRVTLGVLVLQDGFAIVFLALQPNLQNPQAVQLLISFGKALVLMAVAFGASRYVLPRLFRTVAHLPELMLVGALAWCFLMAGLAHWLGLSQEMGALIAGVALSTSPYTLDVTAKVTSLRDFFVTLFFVGLGLDIPVPSVALLGWAALIGLFIVVSRLVTVFPVLHALRQGHRVSLLPAIHLSQISEFALVILVLGVDAGHIRPGTRDLGAYAFSLLAVLSTYAIARSDRLLQRTSPWLKRLGFADLETMRTQESATGEAPKVFLLGFMRTESSLLEELTRSQPKLLKELAVIDFNPIVNERLRQRGVRVIYGDVSQREVLLHAGAAQAEVLVCALPDSLLKGTSKQRLVRQLREINPKARIIVSTDHLVNVAELYAAGAAYVTLPRFTEADDLLAILDSARRDTLDTRRAELDKRLANRREVVP